VIDSPLQQHLYMIVARMKKPKMVPRTMPAMEPPEREDEEVAAVEAVVGPEEGGWVVVAGELGLNAVEGLRSMVVV